MIGVASRNEKRAESSCVSPAMVPATIVKPEREKRVSRKTLCNADGERAFPIELLEEADAFARDHVAEVEARRRWR